MSTAPRVDVDVQAFWHDPYPVLETLRRDAPIAYVPQLGATLLSRRDDIFVCEKNIAVFSSHQPQGLMNRLMGHNLMRKDGEEHMAERRAIFPTVSPKTVKQHWTAQFQAHADRIVDALPRASRADLFTDFALPFSAECLKTITGLTNMRFEDMNGWSQGMIDGVANYVGDPAVEARCHAATAGIDAAIDERASALAKAPDQSLLSVTMQAGMPMDSVRANVKLAISGGQNEPRDAVAGCLWALLSHPEQLAHALAGRVTWLAVFEEFARWIAPIGMSPRRVAEPYAFGGVEFEPEDRVFFMYGSANRDERHFADPDRFEVTRDTSKSIAFGAGPHFCAGAWASRAMIAEVALPTIFRRFDNLRLAAGDPVRFGGWAFRGILNLPAEWDGIRPA